MQVVALTTCFNRKDCTMASLEDLHHQKLPDGVRLSCVIVDDGSTDGTADAVRTVFPDVEILKGDGELFWAGGMRFGWDLAIKQKNMDYLFVYNDDVRLDDSALAELLQSASQIQKHEPHIVVGSFQDRRTGKTSYGGRRRSSRWHPLKFAHIVEPNGNLQVADTLNMNGALISRSALDRIGFLTEYFVHSGADFEYGLKLNHAGGHVYVASCHIGYCELNPVSVDLPQDSASLRKGLFKLVDPKREPFNQRFRYYRQHGGPFWFFLWIAPYITIWPRYALTRLKRYFKADENAMS